MKILLKWLNEYVKIEDLSAKTIAQKLLNIGLEVENISRLDDGLDNVITGKIIEISPHPLLEKLKVCSVDIGLQQPLALVSGATNIHLNMIVPIAMQGANLPCGKVINTESIKGVTSNGMMCSGKELNISADIIDGADIDGVLQFPPATPLGIAVAKVLGLDDFLFDVSVTANRPDCQSVYGIARELAAALNRKLKPLDLNYKAEPYAGENIPEVKVNDHEACALYQGSYIKNVKVARSPQWLRRRLCSAGMRPINNIVDITNYVLLEVGQPLHAFDRKNINENIIVRFSRNGEKIIALDEREYILSSENLVIADEAKPLVIAGVMGGLNSGVTENTDTIFLESAYFARGGIRATSRGLGLSSDSSKRYEKGVDFWSVDTGRKRALALISKLKAGKVVGVLKKDGVNNGEFNCRGRVIKADLKDINALLGIEIQVSFVKKTLTSLGFAIRIKAGASSAKNQKIMAKKSQKKELFEVAVPLFRQDIDNYTDLAEEAIRFYGYDKLIESPITSLPTTIGGISERRVAIEKVETVCNAFGAYETKNFSFISEKAFDLINLQQSDSLRNSVKIANPLSDDYTIMRTQLIFSMLQTVALNLSRQNDDFRIYEIDNVFLPVAADLPIEQKTLCAAFVGAKENFYSIKELAETILKIIEIDYVIKRSVKPWLHPGISADIIVSVDTDGDSNGKNIGSFGKIHPEVAEKFATNEDIYLFELNLEPLIMSRQKNVKFKPLPKFPAVERDLSLTVDELITVGELQNEIRTAGDIVKNVLLTDVYRGTQIPAGKKSVSLRIILQSNEKTLIEKEINDVMNKAVKAVKENFNAVLREPIRP